MSGSGGRPPPTLGARISLDSFHGTIRYVGDVQGARGSWLGVEWDSPERGRHSGEKDGVRYFACSVPGAGSFVRPSPSISYGQSFLQALAAKYVELPQQHGQGRKETVVLGSSNGAIEVEAVGLDKVRAKLAKLERLRLVSLDADGDAVALGDPPPGRINQICPNVRGLDLSNSLLPSWDMVALITAELPLLETLSLNRNRFAPLANLSSGALGSAFPSLRELRLNETKIRWADATALLSVMPCLHYLELGYNGLRSLGGAGSGAAAHKGVQTLNFDGNELHDWHDVMMSLAPFSTLERIILTSNQIKTIPAPPADHTPPPLRSIRHLGLQQNLVSAWASVDALATWFPALETLAITGNPIVEGRSDFRALAVARIPSLLALNGTAISQKERDDCEVFYLSHIARTDGDLATDEARARIHPRWKALCDKHGAPDIAPSNTTKGRDTLAQRLITINVHRSDTASAPGPPDALTSLQHVPSALHPAAALRVLPTTPVRILRMKLLKDKALKIASTRAGATAAPQPQAPRLWLLMDGEGEERAGGAGLIEIDLAQEQESRDLAWWGIQDGSHLVVSFP